MKILFLSPPIEDSRFPQLGMGYVAAFLKKNGHEVVVRDGNNRTEKELVEFARKVKPDAVGITANTVTRFASFSLAKKVKEKLGVPIIFGGIHATLMTDQILKNYKFIDYIVRNEGEYACLNLVNALENKKDLGKIKGISYRKDGKVIHNEREELIKNLDELPFPDWKYFDLRSYSKNPEHPKELLKYPVGSIISSRGCPFCCTFCSTSQFWGHRIRFRSPGNVVDEMQELYTKYNMRYITFNDDNFTADRKRAIEICKEIIKRGLHEKVTWVCSSEVNIVNRELLEWLKKAGCHMIEYGVEDPTPEGTKFFRKAHTVQQLFDAFKLTHEVGLEIRSFVIVGGDHESRRNIELKKKLIEKLNPTHTTASLLLAFPGTELYNGGKERGWWDDSVWLGKCTGKEFHNFVPIYPSKNMSLAQLFAASAEINYLWNKKKGTFTFSYGMKTLKDLIRRRDFLKIYTMGKSVIMGKIRGG